MNADKCRIAYRFSSSKLFTEYRGELGSCLNTSTFVFVTTRRALRTLVSKEDSAAVNALVSTGQNEALCK